MDTAQYWFQAGDTASGYQIERSLRFNSGDSAFLGRAVGTTGDRTLFTWSGWVKRSTLGGAQCIFSGQSGASVDGGVYLDTNDTLGFSLNGNVYNKYTTAVLRDCSAWYHIVVVFDSSNATAANRIRIYINGVEQTNYTTQNSGLPPQYHSSFITVFGADLAIGKLAGYSQYYFSGYLTEVHFIDGQALTPSSFGEANSVTGVWQPKKYTGTYGTNGFYLKFADNSGTTSTTLGKDSSGNGNNWTPNNFSVTAGSGNDSLIDTPTPYADGGNGRGNYATLNALDANGGSLSNGNLEYAGTYSSFSTQNGHGCRSTLRVRPTGKWYVEAAAITYSGVGNSCMLGFTASTQAVASTAFSGSLTPWIGVDASVINNQVSLIWNGVSGGTASSTQLFASYASGDIVNFAIDFDAGKFWAGKNGTWYNSGNPASGTNATSTFTAGSNDWAFWGEYVASSDNSNRSSVVANFGQRPFAYTPPAGFLALNTQNLPAPTIEKPSNYMSVVTDTGANILTVAQGKLLTGAGLIWIKDRANANNHQLLDTVRGGTKVLHTNIRDSETTYIAPSGSSVAWCWSKSAVSGFDIVTFTAQSTASTVAHSLGVAPKFIMFRDLVDERSYGWRIYHADVGAQKHLKFDTTGAATDSSLFSTAPTSVAFDPGTYIVTGNGFNQLVAYLWSEVAGFSKFGSCTLNGSTDDAYVACGFRPSWIMIKQKSSGGHWFIQDAARPGYNVTDLAFRASATDREDPAAGCQIDFTSNGFKIRKAAPSGDYIFAAFAESPFKYSLAR